MEIQQFNAVVIPLRHRFYRYALWLTKDREDAEDLAQETLIRMWKIAERLDDYNSYEALGLRITKNLFIDTQRKRSHETYLPADMDVADNHAGSDLRIIFSESERAISEIIDSLSPAHQQMLFLRNVERKSMKEIGVIMEMKTNTVEVTLSRVRRSIRDQYLKIQNYENGGS